MRYIITHPSQYQHLINLQVCFVAIRSLMMELWEHTVTFLWPLTTAMSWAYMSPKISRYCICIPFFLIEAHQLIKRETFWPSKSLNWITETAHKSNSFILQVIWYINFIILDGYQDFSPIIWYFPGFQDSTRKYSQNLSVIIWIISKVNHSNTNDFFNNCRIFFTWC